MTQSSTYKWVVLVGTFIIYMSDAMEIAILSFTLPAISREFGLVPLEAGFLATATLLGMGVSGPVMGWLADNRGRRFALIVCLGMFAVLTAVVYVVPNFETFLVLRFLAGIGLGGVWSIISAFVVETWPAHQRAKAVAFVLASFPIGSAVAAQLARALLPDWRLLFLVAGVGAVLPLLIAIVALRESGAWQASRAAAPATVSVREIFRPGLARVTILASGVAICTFVAYYGTTTWLPSYLQNERGLDGSTVGQYMTWLNLGMFVGYLAFGWVADRYGKKLALTASLLGAGVLMPVYGLVTDQSALLWLGPLYAFFMTFAGLFGSYLAELYPTAVRTTGAGFCFNLGRGISAFAPMVLGGIAAAASLALGLVISGGIFLLGAVLMFFLPKAPSDTRDADSGALEGITSATTR
ncbi:MFS transporter [Pseudonocardia sp. C8]|uniref:MFS transporter n=1 Tax=Pseudonocardia sp. C8 TaxID=2762759 RepID=UPI001642E21D|nr:MFS transporter [Pseudonocardia sp. C8]MBC3191354.1 MFS transporter [Pseudonocardia sp. C8]